MPVESAQVSDFQSVRKDSPHVLKNADLSYSHADSHACTVENPQNGGKGCSDQTEGVTMPDIPIEPTCAGCGVGSNAWGDLVPCGANGSAGLYHPRCWKEEAKR
jgi:hypothetical protein